MIYRILIPLLFIFTALSYATHSGDFLFYDSLSSLQHNPQLVRLQQQPEQASHWRDAILSSTAGPLKRPVTMASFAVQVGLSDTLSPRHLRWGNIVIHLACGVVLFFLVRALARHSGESLLVRQQQLLAFLVTALWLLHPLNTSTVMYTVQRMSQLSTLFVLAGMLWYLHWRPRFLHQAWHSSDKAMLGTGVTLWTLLAAFSKENGLLLPAYILMLEVILFGFRVNGRALISRQQWQWLLPLLASVGLLLLWLFIDTVVLDWYQARPFSLGERLLAQVKIVSMYLGWLWLPQISSYHFFHDNTPQAAYFAVNAALYSSLVLWVLLLAVASYSYRFTKIPLLALLWFLLGHSVESTFIPLELVFEHRNYLPAIGPLLLLAYLLLRLLAYRRQLGWAVSGLVVVCLATLLWLKQSDWQDQYRLSGAIASAAPDVPRAQYSFANINLQYGEQSTDEALRRRYLIAAREYYLRMQQLDPQSWVALASLLYLDERYFSGKDSQQWLRQWQALQDKQPLTTSDINSVSILVGLQRRQLISAALAPQIDQLLHDVAASHPDEPHLQYNLALMAWYNGDKAAASHALIDAVRQSPGWREPLLFGLSTGLLTTYKNDYQLMMDLLLGDPWLLSVVDINQLSRTGSLQLGQPLFD